MVARGPARAVAGGRDGGQLVWASARVTRARPPAVAVVGLRRNGRTGNGESPAGAPRPPASPARSVHARFRFAAARPRLPAPPRRPARCARP
jgi:hypothetical protein